MEAESHEQLREAQRNSLRQLLKVLIPDNAFYTPRLRASHLVPQTVTLEAYFSQMPFTLRADWVADQVASPPYGTNLTFPQDIYTRISRTSGTTGRPMTWLDTQETWNVMLDNWREVYHSAGITPWSRVFFAFSFGPFLGFWTAFDAASRIGCLCIPGGALTTVARLQLMIDAEADVLCCTPTYALRLAQVAAEEGMDAAHFSVGTVIVAGEPGGSIPSIRERIAADWIGANVVDHHGMTEVGPVTYQCPKEPGVLHVLEHSFLAEVIQPGGTDPTPDRELGELVLTTLRRNGSPLLRYRTGDLVQAERHTPCACGCSLLRLVGGIRGRVDNMVTVRGVNVFPSAIDAVVGEMASIMEYQVDVRQGAAMQEISLRIEPSPDVEDPEEVRDGLEHRLRDAFALRIPVKLVEPGSLPRFELKANRWNVGAS